MLVKRAKYEKIFPCQGTASLLAMERDVLLIIIKIIIIIMIVFIIIIIIPIINLIT